jgi:hypothetical protein
MERRAGMKLIIEISDREYENCKLSESKGYKTCVVDISTILNGTPLEESEDCVKWSDVIYVLTKNRVHFVDMVQITSDLKALPPVVPKQKTGFWWSNENDDLKITEYTCSKCRYGVDDISDYCPNCGAKMDVPDNNVGEMGGEQE